MQDIHTPTSIPRTGTGRLAAAALFTASMATATLLGSALEAGAEGLTDALTGGAVSADVRYRYENVDDGINQDANAGTLRTRLGYRTGSFHDAEIYLELQNVSAITSDHYNDTPGIIGTYAVVADPEGSEVNQAYVTWTGVEGLAVRVGNQRIQLDNDRHIGNVGWRQNEQTYEGAALIYTGVPSLTVTYAYLWNVNTITGGDIDATDSHILHAHYDMGSHGVSAYLHRIDTNGQGPPSWQTYGLRYTGAIDLGGPRLLLTGEYATQGDYMNSGRGDANYLALEVGGALGGLFGKVGYEQLEGDGTNAFAVPLGTNHAFNGWSDVLLNGSTGLPNGLDGLVDTWAVLGHNALGLKVMGIYHSFAADNGSAPDPGTEIDLLAEYMIGGNYSVGAKYAAFSADDPARTDVTKTWLYGTLRF